MADVYAKSIQFGTGGDVLRFLPLVSADDNGKILMVTGGEWGAGYVIEPEPEYEIVSWATGTDEQIAAMIVAADYGLINLSDHWAVGDERTVHLSAMAATGVGESHVEQNIKLVLMDTACQGFSLASATHSGRSTPSFIVGMKNALQEEGYMNSTAVNTNGWSGCSRRSWCNEVFRLAVPSTLRGIFKQFKWKQGQGGGVSSGLLETSDYFGLAPEQAVFGTDGYSMSDESALYSQWEWYQTEDNQTKRLGEDESSGYPSWWCSSPLSDDSTSFCYCRYFMNSTMGSAEANTTFGISPFGCI